MKKRKQEERVERPRPLKKGTGRELEAAKDEWREEWKEKNNHKVVTHEYVDQMSAEYLQRFLDCNGLVISGNLELRKWRAKQYLDNLPVRLNVSAYVRMTRIPKVELSPPVMGVNYPRQGMEIIPYDVLATSVLKHLDPSVVLNIMCMSRYMYNVGVRYLKEESRRVFERQNATPMALFALEHYGPRIRAADTKTRIQLGVPKGHRRYGQPVTTVSMIQQTIDRWGSVDVVPYIKDAEKRNRDGRRAEDMYIDGLIDARLDKIHEYLDSIGYHVLRYKLCRSVILDNDSDNDNDERFEKRYLAGANEHHKLCWFFSHKEVNQILNGLSNWIFMSRSRIMENILSPLQMRPHVAAMLTWPKMCDLPILSGCPIDTICAYIWTQTEFDASTKNDMMYALTKKMRVWHDNNIALDTTYNILWLDNYKEVKIKERCVDFILLDLPGYKRIGEVDKFVLFLWSEE